ncbi:acyl-homoserine-lactone synthase [Methylobacterium indicum]|uniref:acyl-homoserine-lactone synthase n=1 Tax=Methylobacterium indicum TaxID=1775910 RepID=A0A8H9CAQ1_9HYPH|nr:hypothetical protein mvi_61410 [Methylobacterium indicum]
MFVQIDTAQTIDFALRETMLRLRKRVFCEQLGWDIPHCNGQEADIFDFNKCLYLNWLSGLGGDLFGSVRLIPLSEDNLLTTVFKSSVDEGHQAALSRSTRVWEATRLCLDETMFNAQDRPLALIKLLFSLFLACRTIGIERLLCNCDAIVFRRYRSLGLTIDWLGATPDFRHGAVCCLSVAISDQNVGVLDALAREAGAAPVVFNGLGIAAAVALIREHDLAPVWNTDHRGTKPTARTKRRVSRATKQLPLSVSHSMKTGSRLT